MNGLMAETADLLSETAVRPSPGIEHRSAVPEPLNLGTIKAAKEERKAPTTGCNFGSKFDSTEPTPLHGVKVTSLEYFAADSLSDFEALNVPGSSEYNGSKRKGYKGFRRSG